MNHDSPRFARLLGWFPAAWRREHGDELVGTLLDDAEFRGRSAPTVRDHVQLRAMGLGLRLDSTSAVWIASGALVLTLAGAALSLVVPNLSETGVAFAQALQLVLGPVAIVTAVCALLRAGGLVSPLRALATIAAAIGACTAAFVALWLWRQGFERADAGLPAVQWQTTIEVIASLAAWALGTLVVVLLLEPAVSAIRPAAPRWALLVGIGVIASPVLMLSTLFATAAAGVALATLVAAVLVARRRATPAAVAAPRAATLRTPAGSRPAAPLRPMAHLIAWVAAAAGTLGVALALTGSSWPGSSFDGTEAMRAGITIGHLALAGCVIAGALAIRLRWPATTGWLLAPTAVFVASFVIAATSSSPAIGAGDLWAWNGLIVAGVVAGVGIALVVGQLMRGSAAERWVMAGAAGATYAVVGFALAPFLTFLSPLIAGAIGTWLLRAPRNRSPLLPRWRHRGAALR